MKSTQTDLNRAILSQLPIATALVDLSFHLIDASRTWLQLFQTNTEIEHPEEIFTFFHEHVGCTPDLLKEYLIGNDIRTIRHSVVHDNHTQWLESTFAPWLDEDNNIQGTIIQTIDIGRQVQKDTELEQTKKALLFQ